MPPKKFPTIWDAPPHTIAKIEMLQAYLVVWFQIFGRTRAKQELLYVDGFAGPGEYQNYATGSPLAALTAAKKAIELTGTSWIAGDVHCAFIEPDADRFKNLQQKLTLLEKPANILIHSYPETFTRGLQSIKKDISQPFTNQHPLFVFIDPFGATGVPFSAVSELLKSPCSEVLINLDADGIARIFKAGESADHEKNLNEIFAGDEWKPLFGNSDRLRFCAARRFSCTRLSSRELRGLDMCLHPKCEHRPAFLTITWCLRASIHSAWKR